MTDTFDRRIQAYLRTQMLLMADHERVACFLAGFDANSNNPFLNYALPDDGAEPDSTEIAALVAAFARRQRKPRLEYMAAAAPRAEPALVDAGFLAEARVPVMVSTQVMPVVAPAGAALAFARCDSEIVQAAETLATAFGNDAPDPERLRRLLRQGGLLRVARGQDSGAILGAGLARPAHQGVTEIAGIGVLPAFRGRGIAGAIAMLLASEAFGRGAALAWLTPGSEGAQRIYGRAGFARVSWQLHISMAIRGSEGDRQ